MFTSFNLRDSAGGVWQVSVGTSGMLQTAPASGPVAVPVFNDANGTGTKWLLGVTTSGLLTTEQVSPKTTQAIYFWRLWDNLGNQWLVCIDQFGNLLTTQNCMPPFGPTVALGSLIPNGEGYPNAKQPGGPGTPVTDPTQTPNEKKRTILSRVRA